MLSQGLPAIPCALPASCATIAALVEHKEHKDAQSPWQLDLPGGCPESVESSPAPALPALWDSPSCSPPSTPMCVQEQPGSDQPPARASWQSPPCSSCSWRGSLSRSLPASGQSKWLGALLEPRQLGREWLGITRGSASAWAGTTCLQVGQGSLPSHPPRGLTGPSQFPAPALAKAAPGPVPCGCGLGHLQKEQSFSVSLRSLES